MEEEEERDNDAKHMCHDDPIKSYKLEEDPLQTRTRTTLQFPLQTEDAETT